ncbi:MAG: sigma-54-dependent Fis family transcriptional regulator [Deltaproteobacteria bacterium]|nr:sigma-54-dependent Fis family transcriptional regulator [Deltaproteobacteria bacterium]
MEASEPATAPLHVLLVDDEDNIRKTLAYCLESEGHRVVAVSNPTDAMAEMRRQSFDLAFVDLRLGQADGLDLIPVFKSDSPWTKVVVITAYASINTAVEAMRRGAADYIPKPFSADQIRFLARRFARLRDLETEVVSLREDLKRLGPETRPQSRNPGMQRLIETARKAAASEATILLRGESGTGKSILAKAIHHWSPRAANPLAVISCPAVPADLLESEFFGHAKGAFTGAVKDYPGRVALCNGGTLFLDEIGDLVPSVQAKLLRLIQDKEYERLGEATTRRSDVRIIAATNADLEKRVLEGRFRDDLFYRLNVISLLVPPLRERPEDILPLAEDFLSFFARVNHKTRQGFTLPASEALQGYSWPGNIRELRNSIERAVILGSGKTIDRRDLPETIVPLVREPALGDPVTLSVIEELHIRRVLAEAGSFQEAADILGIDQATLWRRRKAYGI